MAQTEEGAYPDPQHAHLRRVVVIGTSGAGKTTLARDLAQAQRVPHVEMDAYRHGPNWTETPDDEFLRLLDHALQSEAWVADGNYRVTRSIIWTRATAIVWLDYAFPLVFWRLFCRTLRRGVLRETLWNGNRENPFSHFFTRNSLFWWAFKDHWRHRRTIPPELAEPRYAHLCVVHLRSSRETARWLADVRQEVAKTAKL